MRIAAMSSMVVMVMTSSTAVVGMTMFQGKLAMTLFLAV
jgi:hypothetical protein